MKLTLPSLLILSLVVFSNCSKDDDRPNLAPEISDQTFRTSESTAPAESIGTVVASDPEEKSLTFSLTSNANNLFEIDSESGSVSLAQGQALDFESANSHTITVEVSDGQSEASATITVTVTDQNEAPTSADIQATADENIDDTIVITTVTADDMDEGATIQFNITTNDDDHFEIDQTTGEITLAENQELDFEDKSEYSIIVGISDGLHSISSVVTITVGDVNESPTLEDMTFTSPEGIDDVQVIGTIAGSDPDMNSNLSYSIIFTTEFNFEINSSTGEITLAESKILDFEHKTNYEIQVQVSDGSLSADATVTIDVTNLLDANVATIAGTGIRSTLDGPLLEATFDLPTDVAIDNDGNLFVVDFNGHTVRKIDETSVSTIAGVGGTTGTVNGTGTSSKFNSPISIAIDASGNKYISDARNHTIRKMDASGLVTTFAGIPETEGSADGTTSTATFKFPSHLVFDNVGNLYVADQGNHLIRKIDVSGNVTTVAGTAGVSGNNNGQGTAARFASPSGLAFDSFGNMYVADISNQVIRKIDPTGNVTTYAGTGGVGLLDAHRTSAMFSFPSGVAIDSEDNIYVADNSNNVIRKIDPSGNVTTLAGSGSPGTRDGQGTSAQFTSPYGIEVDSEGIIYVAGYLGGKIRRIEIK